MIQHIDEFNKRVQILSAPDLDRMGLYTVSFTIKEIRDPMGYLEQLGRKRAARAREEADIGVDKAK